jgi:hypothetical protein
MRNVRVLVIETKRRFSLNALDDQSDVPRLQTAQARRWTARCVTGHRSRGLVPFRLSVAVRQKLKKCVSYFLREGRLCQCVFSRRVDLGTAVNAKPVWAMDGTRIFSNLCNARPFPSIGANRREYSGLASSQALRSHTLEHIESNSSDKVISKVTGKPLLAQRIVNPLGVFSLLLIQTLAAHLVITLSNQSRVDC